MGRLILSVIIFLCVYISFAVVREKRFLWVWGGIILLYLLRIISPLESIRLVNWNIIGIFAGTLLVAELLVESGLPSAVASFLSRKAKNVGWAILYLSILSGFVSSFTENVATVLLLAPIAFELAKRMKVSPVPFLVSISISSNLQGTATLVGDPPSIILADFCKLTFNDFFFLHGKPGIFFAVEIGALFSFLYLYYVFRKYTEKAGEMEKKKIEDVFPIILFCGLIAFLVLVSSRREMFEKIGGLGTMLFGLLGVLVRGRDGKVLKRFDWETLLILCGIFILVGTLEKVGAIELAARKLGGFTKGSIFLTYLLLVVASVAFSAFIDNVPYVTAMIPVGMEMANTLGMEPYLFAFGIVIGATVGGNITPIGASANLVAFGLLRKKRYNITFLDFVKLGLPFTILAVGSACVFLWFVWR